MSDYRDPNKVTRKRTKEELMQLENYDPEYKVDVLVAPCKDCPKRYLGCHDKCYKYQTFRQARDEYNEQVSKKREDYTTTYLYDLAKPYRHGYSIRRKRRK